MGAYLATAYSVYGGLQNLGLRSGIVPEGGWVAYTIHLPEGWRSSVNVVEDRLIMPSKRGKVNKRDAPTDPVFERTPKKSAPTASSSKKAPSKKAKVAKQGKTPLLVPSAAGASTTALAQGSTKSAVAPSKRKTRAGKESKSTPSVPSTAEESTEAFMEEPIESAVSPAEKTKVGKESKSTTSVPLAAKESMAAPVEESAVKKSCSGPPRGQKKVSVSSSTDEEEPSAVPIPSPPKKKKFTAPLFPLGAAGRTRSKSGPKVVRGSGGSGGDTVVVEDSDVAEEDIDAGPPEEDAPSAAAVDQTENLGKMPQTLCLKKQIMSAESTADDEDMPEADDSSVGAAGSMDEDLAIVPHAGYDDDSAVDADVDPISFSLPQPVLTSAGPDTSIAHVMEGISLFGVTPSLRAIPAGGFVIPAGHFTSEDSPVVEGALMPEEIHAQGLVESGSVVDLGHDAPLEGAGASAVDVLAGSDHLENIGVDDAVHVSEEIDEVGITGEVTVVSPPRRPTIEVGSSIDVSSLSSEVAAFLREFDARAPNPHPEQFFLVFQRALGAFWLQALSIGLGGPMMSLLGSVLAAMDESSLEDVTKTQILAWRSVIQDLMDVGFDLGFMMERLRQMAQCVFGKRLTDEIKALQHQIALLQDSLAKLTAYQDAMMSTGEVVPRSERGGSFLDSLLD
uniref:Uncharacterized protein n=1 Tax=Fagus sylvatica TaxID=28930 RepID=A0A2N9GRV0_FAGSY